jgi:hypothetical protein
MIIQLLESLLPKGDVRRQMHACILHAAPFFDVLVAQPLLVPV